MSLLSAKPTVTFPATEFHRSALALQPAALTLALPLKTLTLALALLCLPWPWLMPIILFDRGTSVKDLPRVVT